MLQEQSADAQAQRVHRTGPVQAQLERYFLRATVPGGESGHENVDDGAVHVPVQLDAAVRARVRYPASGRGGVHVRPVRGHAQSARVRVPERRVPQGDAARGVQPETVARVGRGQGDRRRPPTTPADDGPPVRQRVGAQFPHVVRRVPTLVRLGHAAARRLRRHVQPGKTSVATAAFRMSPRTPPRFRFNEMCVEINSKNHTRRGGERFVEHAHPPPYCSHPLITLRVCLCVYTAL